jgi:hypothetical protein|eukprot:COSAG06_NODE_4293_length_4392_cov_13.850454_2_plen_137_part_00
MLTMIISPRRARDKHRESTQKRERDARVLTALPKSSVVSAAVIYRSSDSGKTFAIHGSLSDDTSEADLHFPSRGQTQQQPQQQQESSSSEMLTARDDRAAETAADDAIQAQKSGEEEAMVLLAVARYQTRCGHRLI